MNDKRIHITYRISTDVVKILRDRREETGIPMGRSIESAVIEKYGEKHE